MEKKHVTKELFDTKFEDLKEFIGYQFEQNKKEHEAVMDKQDLTNGRVKVLEFWRMMLIGAWAAITVLFPLLSVYFADNMEKDIDYKIHRVLEDNL